MLKLSTLALAGGLALEYHIAELGGQTLRREQNDFDFVCESYDRIPRFLLRTLLVRHRHPDDPPGKMLLQGIFEETLLRVDIFRAYGGVMDRTITDPSGVRVVSCDDVFARLARLCMPLVRGERIERKFARDFMRLLDLLMVLPDDAIWSEHRKTVDPPSLLEAARRLRALIPSRTDLLVGRVYSEDPTAICPRCSDEPAVQRASAERMLELVGYC